MSSACTTNTPTTLGLYATSKRVQSRGCPDLQRHLSLNHVAARGLCNVSSRSALTTKAQEDGKGLRFPTNEDTVPRESVCDTQPQRAHTVPVNAAEKVLLRSALSRDLVHEAGFENCRESLEKTFRRCEQNSFSWICCALSLLLNSLRPLQQVELDVAVSLVMHGRQQLMLQANASPHDDLHSVDSCLELADAIVAIDETGHVGFKNKRMKEFLQAFWIRGIDTATRQYSEPV